MEGFVCLKIDLDLHLSQIVLAWIGSSELSKYFLAAKTTCSEKQRSHWKKERIYLWKWKNGKRNISQTSFNVQFVSTQLIPFQYFNVVMGTLFAKIVTQNWRIVQFAEMTSSMMDQSEIWNLRKSSEGMSCFIFLTNSQATNPDFF